MSVKKPESNASRIDRVLRERLGVHCENRGQEYFASKIGELPDSDDDLLKALADPTPLPMPPWSEIVPLPAPRH